LLICNGKLINKKCIDLQYKLYKNIYVIEWATASHKQSEILQCRLHWMIHCKTSGYAFGDDETSSAVSYIESIISHCSYHSPCSRRWISYFVRNLVFVTQSSYVPALKTWFLSWLALQSYMHYEIGTKLNTHSWKITLKERNRNQGSPCLHFLLCSIFCMSSNFKILKHKKLTEKNN